MTEIHLSLFEPPPIPSPPSDEEDPETKNRMMKGAKVKEKRRRFGSLIKIPSNKQV